MLRSLRKIRDFGLKTYISRKIHDAAPSLYQDHLARSQDGFVETAYGVAMKENWKDATFRMCVFGSHGRMLSDYLGDFSKPFVFLDVGTNQGLYSLLAARNRHCRKAVAFEPVQATFEILRKNIAHNDLSGVISPVCAAVSDHAGAGEIRVFNGHSGAASLRAVDVANGTAETIALVAAGEIGPMIPEDVDIVVKIDVEGHEETVIEEILKLRQSNRLRALFFEVDSRWVDGKHLEDRLRDGGFRDFRRLGRSEHYDVLALHP